MSVHITRTREDGRVKRGSFIGRRAELDLVMEALEVSAASGRSVLVVVEGEAGIGKSTLVATATQRWQRVRDRRVLRAKADELGSSVSFATLAVALGRVVVDAGDVVDAIEDELAVGGGQPLTVVLDDAQWLDPGSLGVLGRVLDALDDRPLALVLSMRPVPQPRGLGALVTRGGRTTHLVLRGMPVDELAVVVAAIAPDIPQGDVPLDQTGGNPLYAVELARAVLADRAGVAGHVPPLSVTILRRLSYLRPSTLVVLRQAALLGGTCGLRELALVTDGPATATVAAVEEATRAGVLRSEGDELRFSHDLVRAALYEDLPLPVRRFEHGRVGAALAAGGAEAAIVAPHLERAAVPGDAMAIEWLTRAASDASTRSADAAVEWVQRALALQPAPETRSFIASQMAVQLGAAGRFAETVDLTTKELHRAPAIDIAVTLTIALAQATTAGGDMSRAQQLLVEQLAAVRDDPDGTASQRARLVGALCTNRLLAGDVDEAARLAEETLVAAAEAGLSNWVAQAHGTKAALALGSGNVAEGLRLAELAVGAMPVTESPVIGAFSLVILGSALLEADQLAEAVRVQTEAVAASESAHTESNLPLGHAGLAFAAMASGDLDECQSQAETALAIGRSRDIRSADFYAHGLLARVALHRGDLVAAEVSVAAGEAQLAATGPGLGAELILWARALLEEAVTGSISSAVLDGVTVGWQLHPLRHLLTWRLIAPDLVRWALAANRRDLAASVAADVTAALDDAGAVEPGRRGLRDLLRAQCEGSDAATLRAAADVGAEGPRPLEAAAARATAGLAFLAAGDRPEGARLLRLALATYETVGAPADVERLSDAARRHGVRLAVPVRTGARDGSASENGLTATERKVARLAAAGLTNRAIAADLTMSRHTVDTHLRHVYRKLSIASRVELARHPLVR